jgi:hypothetical protein
VAFNAEHGSLVRPSTAFDLLPTGVSRARAATEAPERFRSSRVFLAEMICEEATMGRGLLLWLIGVPIPVIILLWLFFGR